MKNQSGKDTTNGCFQIYHIKFILVLKLYKLCLFDPSIVFQFNFGINFLFLLVFNLWFFRGEREHWIPAVERENQLQHRFWPPK